MKLLNFTYFPIYILLDGKWLNKCKSNLVLLDVVSDDRPSDQWTWDHREPGGTPLLLSSALTPTKENWKQTNTENDGEWLNFRQIFSQVFTKSWTVCFYIGVIYQNTTRLHYTRKVHERQVKTTTARCQRQDSWSWSCLWIYTSHFHQKHNLWVRGRVK